MWRETGMERGRAFVKVGERKREKKRDEFFCCCEPLSFLLSLFLSLSLPLSLPLPSPLSLLTPVVIHLVDDDAEAVPLLRGDGVVAPSPSSARRRLFPLFAPFSPPSSPPLLVKGQETQVRPVAQEVAVGEDRIGLGELGVDEGHGEREVCLSGVLFFLYRRQGRKLGKRKGRGGEGRGRGEREREREAERGERRRKNSLKRLGGKLCAFSFRFEITHGSIDDV